MSLRRRGVPVDRYMVYVVLMWLGRDVGCTTGVPCPQEERNSTVLLDTHDTCTPGDTCETDCTPQDKNFKCSVHDETGWRQYETRYQTGYFSLANENGPELVAISMHHKRYNATGRTYFRPALSVTINISAEILGTSATTPRNPEALLVRISGVNDSESVRDDFYIDTPLYRLYSFRNYTPTSHDKDYPRQALLKCIDSLDACSVKVYRLEIRAFVPSIRFMTRIVYTITAPNSKYK
ncbi:hypothetical protein KP79_PYT11320 [Mizuhopecten yessoensis]|uniref:Uncharacterized protein n=1 Tax=Mizuhopecten yessoensis TaxID=6573 RepID=A0A210R3Q1_MIZYE|nr:hypothetical protein KP79_PYT11320 [Mizuhopecten yessoensis]